MSSIIESLERRQMRKALPFRPGDRVKVHFQVIEGQRRRTQVFEGIVIKRQGAGVRETFTVRKQSFGVGVERTFPVHSPKIEKLEVAGRGDVNRAKLYYLRDKVGKRARVAERRWGIEDELVLAAEQEAEAVDSEGVAVSEAEVIEPPAEGEDEGESGGEDGEDGGEDEGESGGGGGEDDATAEPAEQPEAAAEQPEAAAEQPEAAAEQPEAAAEDDAPSEEAAAEDSAGAEG